MSESSTSTTSGGSDACPTTTTYASSPITKFSNALALPIIGLLQVWQGCPDICALHDLQMMCPVPHWKILAGGGIGSWQIGHFGTTSLSLSLSHSVRLSLCILFSSISWLITKASCWSLFVDGTSQGNFLMTSVTWCWSISPLWLSHWIKTSFTTALAHCERVSRARLVNPSAGILAAIRPIWFFMLFLLKKVCALILRKCLSLRSVFKLLSLVV